MTLIVSEGLILVSSPEREHQVFPLSMRRPERDVKQKLKVGRNEETEPVTNVLKWQLV